MLDNKLVVFQTVGLWGGAGAQKYPSRSGPKCGSPCLALCLGSLGASGRLGDDAKWQDEVKKMSAGGEMGTASL